MSLAAEPASSGGIAARSVPATLGAEMVAAVMTNSLCDGCPSNFSSTAESWLRSL